MGERVIWEEKKRKKELVSEGGGGSWPWMTVLSVRRRRRSQICAMRYRKREKESDRRSIKIFFSFFFFLFSLFFILLLQIWVIHVFFTRLDSGTGLNHRVSGVSIYPSKNGKIYLQIRDVFYNIFTMSTDYNLQQVKNIIRFCCIHKLFDNDKHSWNLY